MNAMDVRRSELFSQAAARAAETARLLGVAADVAEQIGAAVADALAQDWAGQVISIPVDYAFRLAQRDRLILEEYRRGGCSFAELARKYNMTDRGMRKLIERARVRDRQLAQLDMFGSQG
ncbi:Mor transcription activator family protein [Lysobacter sp. CA199]|uniref:Mor transcription activator family protein n=1 Tax=Lysobacter sp. CA199 TaxID=3455608 RepID=UPI003F8D5E36